MRRQRAVPAGRRRGTPATAPPIALSPGYCTLSILFSDWDGSGRRDLRGHQRPPLLPRRARSSCGASRPARRRALYTAADGWASMQIWGMGIASQDLTGDGCPEVYLTSQGDNKLQTLAGRAAAARLPRHRARATGVTASQPFAGGDALPSTAWHPEFEDVNNDGLIGPVRVQGQRRRGARLRDEGPEQPAPRPARRHVRRGRRGGRHRVVRLGPRRRARRLQPGRAARPRRGRTSARRCGVAQRRAGIGRCAGADGQLARRSGCTSPAATATRSAR